MLFIFFFLATKLWYSKGITLDNTCTGDLYFNTYLFECQNCPTDLEYNPFLKGCSCKIGNYYDIPTQTCLLCIPDTTAVSSRDRSRCMLCEDSKDITSVGGCKCDTTDNKKYTLVETDSLGFLSDKKSCLELTEFDNKGGTVYPEEVCTGGKKYLTNGCQCATDSTVESQDICISLDNLSFLTISYKKNPVIKYPFTEDIKKSNVFTSVEKSSGLIDYFYDKAARDCYYELSLESCQILANLCVLRMYDETSPECKLYNHINFNKKNNACINSQPPPGWKLNMPWLFYKTSETEYANAEKIIKNANRINFNVAFEANNIDIDKLQFYIGKFTMNGTFAGLLELNDSFILCTNKMDDGTDYRTFGRTIVNDCDIDLQKYLKRDYQMYFYEIFLHNPNNTQDPFVDVPLLIDNIYNEKATTSQRNNEAKMPDWILTRRMFIIDNLSALKKYNETSKETAELITYAKTIKFVIELQKNEAQSKIYVPYAEIFYTTRTANDIVLKPNAYVAFSSEYTMDISNFMNICLALLITITVLSIIIAFVRMYVWSKVNPSVLSPKLYALKYITVFIFKLFRFWGFMIFWFIWIITAYWYIFFKLQFRVFLLLPPLSTYDLYYKKFDIVFGLGFGTFAIYIFYCIYCQSSYDIFFIDWEQEKEILEKNIGDKEMHSSYYKYKGAWRMIQVINRFSELSKKRNVSFYFCIVWVLLMYYRVDWWYKDMHVPRIVNVEHSPTNFVIRHFVTSFIILICGITQFCVIRLLQIWIPLKTIEFLDLCSVSNMSVFILNDKLHGYYLHGKSPLGKADSNLNDLLRFLEREGKDKTRDRGISDGEASELQSYDMYISYGMRIIYEGLYLIQAETFASQHKRNKQFTDNGKLSEIVNKVPLGDNLRSNHYLSNYMNNQLKNMIEIILINPTQYVYEMMKFEFTCINKFLSMILCFPPSLTLIGPNTKSITLFQDKRMNFDEVLFCGIEFDWFIFDLYMFQMWMRALDNMEIAFFLTILIDKILIIIRNRLVERNLGKKSIIDSRFIG